MTRFSRAAAILAPTLALAPAAATAETLTLFVSGQDLATEGFNAPQLTKDGWQLSFSRVIATVDHVTAWRTDPPFAADGPGITGDALEMVGPFTVDLVAADDKDRVEVATVDAEQGFYNALSWTLAPAPEGEFEGFSLVFEGTATRDGEEVDFTLATRDAIAHACGEYVGDERKGFVTTGEGSDLEITLHLDHLFGRADWAADDPTNLEALGFDAFAEGGMQEFSLNGLHVGHVGEGHCHDGPL
ncbi:MULTISPECIES: hypothetical protein [unclassified Ectothiorhodospira]|uniref:hypothetical protein n=1 Tax=unclassified Ectothiorhodospira TaxID=2684909 RepID=UPI001EE82D32|nr:MULTISPECIES: hypothetical protein [unclassified Ectothiorhodospira]MCG5516794.1 hypothetical protein [Ectothiorhodospira sp. 9100]MCG5519786.1 hypothetical protein [Ectothiorhodospira sp. 9905]